MNKQQYKQGYRLTRLINQLKCWPNISDRIGKKCLRTEMKQLGLNEIDKNWLQTNYNNSKKPQLVTAYSEKIYRFNTEYTIKDNKRMNNNLFVRRLKEIYG